MFIPDMFDRLFCCGRKVIEDEIKNGAVVQEEIVLQHTNNNKTEYITSSQLLERLKGGTTAVVALVREKRLVVAWLGDSLALLVRKREPVHVVTAHKADNPEERERIETLGGCVIDIQGTWRVLGQLAVSRAIGDATYKPYVSSECDIKSLEIVGDEDFLILACDGLWDTIKPEVAVDIVYAYLQANEGDTDGVGRCLVEAARSRGSEDNITAVVVFLREVQQLMEEEQIRVEKGEVSKTAPLDFVVQKDNVVPPSMNNIFVPPPELAARMQVNSNGLTEHHTNDTESQPSAEIGYESDEGIAVGKPDDIEYDFRPTIVSEELKTGTVAPTAEEVDAALAELDSLPDGTCEVGDVDDGDEEEEWNYFKGPPENKGVPYSPDDMVPSAQLEQNELNREVVVELEQNEVNKEMVTDLRQNEANREVVAEFEEDENVRDVMGEPMESQKPDLVTCIQTESPSSPHSSPIAPSSPRVVEGFVTSVELNTPGESFGSSFAINPPVSHVNGLPIMDNASGPFSVYVSNSPEPDSHSLDGNLDIPSPSVEIVHAQSTVEVTPTETGPSDSFPLIMTQSVTGELNEVPYEVKTDDIISPREAAELASTIPDVVSTDLLTQPPSASMEIDSAHQEEAYNPFDGGSTLDDVEMPKMVSEVPDVSRIHFNGEPDVSSTGVPENYDLPHTFIPQLETVTLPLIETAEHSAPLESPLNEFNILDTPPVEVKTYDNTPDVLMAHDDMKQVEKELLDEIRIIEAEPMEQEAPIENTQFEPDTKQGNRFTLPEPIPESVETEDNDLIEAVECAALSAEPSTPRIEELETFSNEQLNQVVKQISPDIFPASMVHVECRSEESTVAPSEPTIDLLMQNTTVTTGQATKEEVCPIEDVKPVEELVSAVSSMTVEVEKVPIQIETTTEVPKVHKPPSPVPVKEDKQESPKEIKKATPAARTSLGAAKSAPKPSPRTVGAVKAPVSRTSSSDTKSKKPLVSSTVTKSTTRPSSVSLAKPKTTVTTTTKTTASRMSNTSKLMSKVRTTNTVTGSSAAPPKSTGVSARPTTAKPTSRPTSTTAAKPRPFSAVTKTTTATKGPLSSAKSSPTGTRAVKSVASKTSTSTTVSVKVGTSGAETTTTTKSTSRRPISSVPSVHKSSASSTVTRPSTTAPRTTSATSKTTVAKDTKNTTNRLLSTTSKPLPKAAPTKVSTAGRTRPTGTTQVKGTTKPAGLKTKSTAAPLKKAAPADSPASAQQSSNGEENKIVEENVSVESKSKDNEITKSPEKSADLIIDSPQEVLVNGEH